MTNPDPRGGVPYTVGERVLYTEANLMCSGIVNSIDGSAGGSYSPSAAITIAGSNGLIIGGTGAANRLRYTSRQVTRAIPQPQYNRGSGWVLSDDTALPYWATSGTTVTRLWWPLIGLPYGAVLDEVAVGFLGNLTGATMPTTMPSVQVYRHAIDSGAVSTVAAEYFDTTATQATFEAEHTFTKTAIAHTIDTRSYTYIAVIRSPTGGNTDTGAFVRGLSVTCTLTDQSEYNP